MTSTTTTRPFITVPANETLSGHQLYLERIPRTELPDNLQEKAKYFSQFYAVRNYDASGIAFFYLATKPDEGALVEGLKRGDKAVLYRNGQQYISGVTCKAKSLPELAYLGQQFGWLCTID